MRKTILLVGVGLSLAGCHTDMWVQPRLRGQGTSDFFADEMASRPKIPGTVAQGKLNADDAYNTGREGGKLVTEIPSKKAMEELGVTTYKGFVLRGQDRYGIFCSHCHGALGDGQGMIAQRGLQVERPVASFHTDRLRTKLPIGHVFEAQTKGYGVMLPSAGRVPVADRWAIAAYIRVLQRSQAADAPIGTPAPPQKVTQ